MAAGQDPEGAQVSSAWRAWHAGRVTLLADKAVWLIVFQCTTETDCY